MFSLRANKSMRLQRFGAWIAYHDTQSDSVFWYDYGNIDMYVVYVVLLIKCCVYVTPDQIHTLFYFFLCICIFLL